jgi:hypothetical protein
MHAISQMLRLQDEVKKKLQQNLVTLQHNKVIGDLHSL